MGRTASIWSEYQLRIIRKYYPKESTKDIIKRLDATGLTVNIINALAKKMGLKKDPVIKKSRLSVIRSASRAPRRSKNKLPNPDKQKEMGVSEDDCFDIDAESEFDGTPWRSLQELGKATSGTFKLEEEDIEQNEADFDEEYYSDNHTQSEQCGYRHQGSRYK